MLLIDLASCKIWFAISCTFFSFPAVSGRLRMSNEQTAANTWNAGGYGLGICDVLIIMFITLIPRFVVTLFGYVSHPPSVTAVSATAGFPSVHGSNEVGD
jgi:hypothetical protein